MKKAKYVIILISSGDSYFVEISKTNKITSTRDIGEATKMDYSDAEELIPLIELYSGHVAIAEPI